MQNTIAPFNCKYTSHVPELLIKLKCSIAVSTYQAGKLIFLSPKDQDAIIQLPRTFDKPMGIALKGNKLALATRDEVITFANSPGLAEFYPKSNGKYDALFMPRMTYHTGALDFHDLSYGTNDELFAVNTLFSCIVKLDDEYNFTPVWKPDFIDALVSEDRCHLNGMAMDEGKPKYATAFNTGNSLQSWREHVTSTGVVIDVETQEVISKGLGMPHSPKIFNGELYVLLSAKGDLVHIDRQSGKVETVIRINGFVRGMDLYKDYLFIGLSKLRRNSSTFAKLNLDTRADEVGVEIYHLPTMSLVGSLRYETSVDEIYDLKIIPESVRPNILNTMKPDYKNGLMIPGATYWAKGN